MPTLYALRALTPTVFQMAKFDESFTVEATYTLERRGTGYSCDCPAGYRTKLKPCKHQRMIPFMMGAVNLPRFYDAETGNWHGLLEAAPGMAMEHAEGEQHIKENTFNGDGSYGAAQVPQGVKDVPKPLGAQDPGDIPVDEDGLEAELEEDGDIPDDAGWLKVDPAKFDGFEPRQQVQQGVISNKEPAPAAPDQAGHGAAPTSPPGAARATEAQRPTAPAAPSNLVTRRI